MLVVCCLVEADWSHIEAVLCVDVRHLGWCEVCDWKSNVFVLCEFQGSCSPRFASVAAVVVQNLWCVSVDGSRLLEDRFFDSLEFHGVLVSASHLVVPDGSFLAVDGDVLHCVVAQKSQELHLFTVGNVFDRSQTVVFFEIFLGASGVDL